MVTGFALSFLFVPIGNMATLTVTNEQMGNATGIFNLLRNIGGSIGISMAATMLTRRMAFHQTRIAGSVPLSGLWFEQHARADGRVLRSAARSRAGSASCPCRDVHAAATAGAAVGLRGHLPLDGAGGFCGGVHGVAVSAGQSSG